MADHAARTSSGSADYPSRMPEGSPSAATERSPSAATEGSSAARHNVEPPAGEETGSRRLLVVLAYFAGWLLVALPVAGNAFLTAERDTVLAGHDATVSPTNDGWATIDLGAYLPNVRYPTG
ncbi:MAG: hypothetical protein H0T14_09400, partial [Nocardioidaceae bacterium]|nr:hypothetical protein [Nocardioidaceae bacterium]